LVHSAVQLDARPQGRVIRIATLSGDAVVGREARPTAAIAHDLRGLNLLNRKKALWIHQQWPFSSGKLTKKWWKPCGWIHQPHLSHFQGTSPEASLCKGVQKRCNGGQKHQKLRTNGGLLADQHGDLTIRHGSFIIT